MGDGSVKKKDNKDLLREVFHAFKNNLQIICSILYLQTSDVKSTETVEVLKITESRVKTIALAYDKLYASGNYDIINFGEYARDLSESVFFLYPDVSQKIVLDVDIDDTIEFDIKTAIPCGLIIAEVITNSLRHAFKNASSGNIFIRCAVKNKKYVLEAGNDGIDFPEKINMKKPETLGLQLISSLVSQLGGNVSMKRTGGTEYTIKF